MTLNENIKELRLARNLSQVDLAKALGVTKQSISNWENNYIQPSIDMLIRLSAFFCVSTDALLGLEQRKYIEITGLTDSQLAHIVAIINDINGKTLQLITKNKDLLPFSRSKSLSILFVSSDYL